MVRIELHAKAPKTLGGQLRLMPGLNLVDDAAWAWALKHQLTPWFIEAGVIRVLRDDDVPVAGVREDAVVEQQEIGSDLVTSEVTLDLAGLSARAAVVAVRECSDQGVLLAALDSESRKGVVAAIEARVDELSKSPAADEG